MTSLRGDAGHVAGRDAGCGWGWDWAYVAIRAVEAMIIWGAEPELNERGSYTPPRLATCVINRWYNRDGERRYRNVGPMRTLPDVLTWDGKHWRLADRLRKPYWERT